MLTKNMTIEEYVKVLSSKAAIPGGGGASALSGTLGAALACMVCNLTIGKKKYMEVETDISKILEQMQVHGDNFLILADQDAAVFEPLAKAYGLASKTEQEKTQKAAVMETLLVAAAQVPVGIMKEAISTLASLDFLAEKGSVMAVSDVGVSIQLMRTAITGAMMNVRINTKSMHNKEEADKINSLADKLFMEGTEAADKIYTKVLEGLS